jgi:hypothetical protein
MVAQITTPPQSHLQAGDFVVARWSDEATGTVTETFTKGTRKPVHWATIHWKTGDSAGKTSSHPFKQLRKAEPRKQADRSPISEVKFQRGERVAGQMYFQGQNRPFIGAVVAAEFDTAVRLEWLMEVDGEICRGGVQMPIAQLEKLDAADPRLCCPVSLPSPTAECLRAIDEEYQAALEGQSQEWVVADGFAVNDHTWKPLLASVEPTTLEDLATRINALDREAAEAEVVSINACRSALEMRRQQGEMLLQAKSQLKHGEWLPWLGKHCTVGDRQAQKYMKIAKGWDALIAKANSDAFLTIDQAVKMLSAEKEKPPKEKLPTIEEIHQIYAQVGTIKPQPTPSLPNAFQVLNESFGMPFPLYFKGVREALKWWQTKGDQLVQAVNRVAAQQAAPAPAQSCQQCKHRSLTDDGSTWQCDARADGYQHPVTRDIASESGCRLFKALAPVSVEIINPVIAPEQDDELKDELASEPESEPEQNALETPAAPSPTPPTASITDALDPPPQTRVAAIYSPHRQPLNRPEPKSIPAPVTVCLKLTNFGKQLDLSGVIAQIVVQSAGQTYALTCDDLILETD